jgi:hypothetical protein
MKYLISIFLWINLSTVLAQNGTEKSSIAEIFDGYQKEHLVEKIFVHTDKDNYLTGEICWFKVYVVDGMFHKPLDLSKVAYVEILDAQNNAVTQAKIALKQGLGNGSFQLGTNVASGTYRLRAYTRWMQNYAPVFYFEKVLHIINTKSLSVQNTALADSKYDLGVFPEGGNLVNELTSKIAFRFTKDGRKITGRGVLLNQQNDTLLSIVSDKMGMGAFELKPLKDQLYRIVAQTSDGKKITQNIPPAYNEGLAMQVSENESDTWIVEVKNKGFNADVYLFAHTRGITKIVQKLQWQNDLARVVLDKKLLGDGVSHLTLFDANQQPLCERLLFSFPKNPLSLQIKIDTNAYQSRDLIDVSIQTNASPKIHMSMAVYRIDSLQNLPQQSIVSHFLLSADLPQNVQNLQELFDKKDTKSIDLLMLTDGWRRFSWKDIFSKNIPAFSFQPEYGGHLVLAKVSRVTDNAPASNVASWAAVLGKNLQAKTSQSGANGLTIFELNDFYNDGETLFLTDSTHRLEVLSPFSSHFSNTSLPQFTMPMSEHTLAQHHAGVQIQQTYVGKQLRLFEKPSIDTVAFYGKPDLVFPFDEYVRFNSMEEVLREFVARVNVRKRDKRTILPVWNSLTETFFEGNPLVFLDGLPIFEMEQLMKYNPLKIKNLEVVTRPYFLGNRSFEGILNFQTYQGTLPNYPLNAQTMIVDYEGLQKQRIFYGPSYKNGTTSPLPDFREVLSWSPDLTTDKNGLTNVQFYASDVAGKFVAVLQGLNSEGQLGYQAVFFEVKEKKPKY